MKQILGLVVLLIIIYLVYGALSSATITINSARSLSLSVNQTLFVQIYNGTTTALKLHSLSATGATFYVIKVPVLYNPLVTFSLSPLSSVNVSSDGSKTADMNIQLISTSASGATVEVTPLEAALGIRPSSSILLQNPAGLGVTQSASLNLTATQTTTTVTTVSSTTTVAQNSNAALLQSALRLANLSGIGGVIAGYNKLYMKDTACDQSVYDITYKVYYGSLPPPPESFANMSFFTPTMINVTESLLPEKNNVKITYSTVSPSPETTGPAVIVVVNTSSASYLKNVTFTGIYQGWDVSLLTSTYDFQNGLGGSCGAYISPPP